MQAQKPETLNLRRSLEAGNDPRIVAIWDWPLEVHYTSRMFVPQMSMLSGLFAQALCGNERKRDQAWLYYIIETISAVLYSPLAISRLRTKFSSKLSLYWNSCMYFAEKSSVEIVAVR